MADTLLDVVNDDDEVIGQALRSEIHAKKLLHREANVWFVTPQRELIFQKRSMTKENYPGLLTTTAGGHVEVGDDYLTAAIKEVYEETGLVIPKDELNFLGFKKYLSHDPLTGTYNYSFRAFYGFVYRDDLAALKAEAGAGDGFETLALETILELPEEVKVRIVPSIVDEDKYGDIYLALGELVK